MTVAENKDRFLKQFEQFDRATASPKYQPLRQSARGRFRALPLPTPRTEDWRFTSIAPLLKEPFELPAAATVDAAALPAASAANALRLVFVNGRFAAKLSRVADLAGGAAVGSLADAPDAVNRSLGRVADFHDQVFTALNTGLLGDGAYVIVPDGQTLDRPIEVIYLAQPAGRTTAAHPRMLVLLGKAARATVIERYLPVGAGTYFTNAVTEVVLGADAALDHVKLQQEAPTAYHVANTQFVLSTRSRLTTHTVTLGSAWSRNEVRVRFDGEHAEATVNGLYLGTDRQHLDHLTILDHAMPHCASHELYKGILDGHAHGVFNGKIFVRKDAAEDRRQADEQGAAPLRRRDDRHQAAAGDFRRRCQVHPRCNRRPARRGAAVLPAQPRA